MANHVIGTEHDKEKKVHRVTFDTEPKHTTVEVSEADADANCKNEDGSVSWQLLGEFARKLLPKGK